MGCAELKMVTNRVSILERDFGKLIAEFRGLLDHQHRMHESYVAEIDRLLDVVKCLEGKPRGRRRATTPRVA